MTTAVTLAGVSRRFAAPSGAVGDVHALAGIDLQIGAGTFAALLGPSGCGKSTLLRLVAGLERPDAGSVRLTGATPRVSYVFQDATLMPWADVFDNVWLPLRIQGVPRRAAHARVGPLLDSLGLGEFAGAMPHQLSGGMKMRVSIARALVVEPDLLLMDEPFGALDELSRERLNDDLLALWQRRGFTVLFVTHSVFEAVYLAQRVLVMGARPGRLRRDFPVVAPYPRGAAWRLAPEALQLCRQASEALQENQPAGALAR